MNFEMLVQVSLNGVLLVAYGTVSSHSVLIVLGKPLNLRGLKNVDDHRDV